MNINRNNYESFFLMYVDNELSAVERLSVETFVQQFPYLAEELELLMEMILPANDAIIFDKTSLYKPVALGEKDEEALLLYLDNELPLAEKADLLHHIKNNTNLKENWALLQKTKLDGSEVISFPNKKLLYRKKAGRLVNATFVKWAVAAAFIAAGFFIGIAIIKTQHKVIVEVASTKTPSLKSDAVSPGVENKQFTPTPGSSQVAAIGNKTGNKKTDNDALVTNMKKEGNSVAKTMKKKTEHIDLIAAKLQNKQDQANMIVANNPEDLNIKKNENAQLLTAYLNNKIKPGGIDVFEDVSSKIPQNSYAKLTGLEEKDESTDDHIFLLNKEVVTKSKAGIFFKKLKRTVARTTNIKTGNSLKIAGFEFAVK